MHLQRAGRLRELGQQGDVRPSLLAGLAGTRLSRPLTELHKKPAHDWTLEQLSVWRIKLALKRLLRDQPLKSVANNVGYQKAWQLSSACSADVWASQCAVGGGSREDG